MKQNTVNTLGVLEIKMGCLGVNKGGVKYKDGVDDVFHSKQYFSYLWVSKSRYFSLSDLVYKLLGTRMSLPMCFLEFSNRYMSVNLSCGETSMPKHFLNCPKIRTVIKQVGCVTMPEFMRS